MEVAKAYILELILFTINIVNIGIGVFQLFMLLMKLFH